MLKRIRHHIRKLIEKQANAKMAGDDEIAAAKHYLRNIEGEQRFFLHGGGEISSLANLAAYLHDMSMKTFIFHVNHEKNDFHSWVKEIIGDQFLAEELLVIRSKREAVDVVKNRVSELKRMID